MTSFFNLLWQTNPYGGTSDFQTNFFYGGGIGYWFIFLLLAIAAFIFIYWDSERRKLPAIAWRIGAFVAVLLLVPAMLYKFTVRESQVYDYFFMKDL
ncbi:MAG: hypothetical protein JW862_05350, partial [Anaerolineales bacterium]|nr:hypothetical protein [Anaerolineales bacterium]